MEPLSDRTGVSLHSDYTVSEIRPGDFQATESASKALQKYMASIEGVHTFDPRYPQWIDEKTLSPSEDKIVFVINNSRGELIGFAQCYESSGTGSLADQTNLKPFRNSAGKPLTNLSNATVDKSELHTYPGYDTYEGGKILYIDLIEVFCKGLGAGAALVKYLQSPEKGYALIEAEANGDRPFEFFTERCGFEDTGLSCESGEELVVVWQRQLKTPKVSDYIS